MEGLLERVEKLRTMNQNRTNTTTLSQSESRVKTECNICSDLELIFYTDENGIVWSSQCKCKAAKNMKRRLKVSGISEEFLNKTFDSYKTQKSTILHAAKTKCWNYARDLDSKSIYLSGQPGAGKTHLSIAIANELMKKGIAVLYMQYREVIGRIKRFSMDAENFQKEIDNFKMAKVLLADDLFKGKTTEADINIMFEIINHRYLNNMTMIISTEKSIIELLEIDEAIGSRIVEMCKGNIIEFRGNNLNYRIMGGTT